jgi:tripartite-type tricarboxylate transporter receptor subunit TctC
MKRRQFPRFAARRGCTRGHLARRKCAAYPSRPITMWFPAAGPTDAAARRAFSRGAIMKIIAFGAAAICFSSTIVPVAAQSNYPNKSIRLIYDSLPGADLIARIYADELAKIGGKPVVVDNVTGAGGRIAADHLAKALPDGYSIGMLPSATVIMSPLLYAKLSYNPAKDFVPVTQVFGFPNLLLVNNDVPAKNVQELVELARGQPNKLTYGHVGTGTTTHLSAELFKTAAHIAIQGVPYRGPPQVATDLMSGRITMAFGAPGPLLPLVREGKIRALAVTSRTRAAFAPDLPTMQETGVSEFDITVWYGLFVPAKTSPAIVEWLNRETVKIMHSPDIRARIISLGNEPMTNTPTEFVGALSGTPVSSKSSKSRAAFVRRLTFF